METTYAPLLLVVLIVAVLVVFTRLGRLLAGVVLFVALLLVAKKIFVRTTPCPGYGLACNQVLQPVWAGFCTSSGDAGILKIDGEYVLTAPASSQADATCIDIRVWRQ